MFQRLVSVRLGRFIERSGVLPTTQFAYRKGLGTGDALLCVSHSLQTVFGSRQEARIVQIGFRLVDRVNQPLIGFCGYWRFCIDYIDSFYQIDHSTLWRTDCSVRSATWNCFGQIIVPPVYLGAFSILENKLIAYADD